MATIMCGYPEIKGITPTDRCVPSFPFGSFYSPHFYETLEVNSMIRSKRLRYSATWLFFDPCHPLPLFFHPSL